MKKILITGSHGFLARNTALLLKKNSYKVYGIGNGKWSKSRYKKWGYEFLINGEVNLKNLLNNFNDIDYIVHCAGRVIGLSPNEDFLKNVLPTQSVLEFVRIKKMKSKIIFLSTIAVNGSNSLKKISENLPANPTSNYALNKKIAEDLLFFYSKQFKIDVLIARTTSLYGEGLKRQFIFDVCNKLSRKKPNFFGTGNEIRDWLHVSDMSNLILQFIRKSFKKTLVINCGSGVGNKIKDVLKILMKELQIDLVPKFNKVSDSNQSILIANINKAKKFGWKPKKKLKVGLSEYAKWYKNNLND